MLQFGIILNNEISVLKSFFHVFIMIGKYFSEFQQFLFVGSQGFFDDSMNKKMGFCDKNPLGACLFSFPCSRFHPLDTHPQRTNNKVELTIHKQCEDQKGYISSIQSMLMINVIVFHLKNKDEQETHIVHNSFVIHSTHRKQRTHRRDNHETQDKQNYTLNIEHP